MASYWRAWSKFKSSTSSCGLPCKGCAKESTCFKGKGTLRPLPGWLWAGGALAFGVPFLINQNADSFVDLTQDDKEELNPSESSHYNDLLQRIGVKNPSKVKIFKSDATHPSVIGTNNGGAVILIPRQMLEVNDPEQVLEIATQTKEGQPLVFEGYAKDFTSEIRDKFADQGILFPTQSEVDYIIGHEMAHILYSDTIHRAMVGTSLLLGSHLAIKSYNQFASNSTKLPVIKGLLPHAAIVYGTIAFGIAGYVLYTERRADITSATKLENAETAIHLVEKKILQNKVAHDLGNSYTISASGNDWSEWEHPSLTSQLAYLKEIQKHQNK